MKHVTQISRKMPLQAEASEKLLFKTIPLLQGKDPLWKESPVPPVDDPSGL